MPLLPLLIYSFMCVLIFKPDSISGFFLPFFDFNNLKLMGSLLNYVLSRQSGRRMADALDLPSTQGSPIIR